MNIRLSNRTRRMVHFEIPPEHGVKSTEPQKVARVTRSIDPLGGPIIIDMSVSRLSFPTTITLCARGTPGCVSDELPESVLQAPSIQNALRSNPPTLEVERIQSSTTTSEDTSSEEN